MTKNGITQPFLERLYTEVLIFWCPIRVRWKQILLFNLCQIGGLAPVRLNPAWIQPSDTPLGTPEHPCQPKTSLNTPEDTPICPLTFPKMKQTLTYAKGHRQTLPVPTELSQAGATPSFWHKFKRQDFFATLFWDIKISKPPYVPFLKMVEFCNFLQFLDLSEKN